jgi:hypothetical protein
LHLIQSFKPNEITPEEAHRVSIELAKRLLGKYEVVIGTHIDHEHIHSHVVFNSVSFVDGEKFRNDFKAYFHVIRKTSDEICREHKLSVIEKPQARGKHYAEWRADKEGKPTIRSQIKADIDSVIPRAINWDMFIGLLRANGFKVSIDENHKYITLLAPYAKRAIRLSEKLGKGYTVDEIKYRIDHSLIEPYPFIKPPPKRYFCAKLPSKPVKRYKGIQALYWHYTILLRRVKKRRATPKQTAYLRKEVTKMQGYIKQQNFLDVRNLQTPEDVRGYWEKVAEMLSQKLELRHELRNRGEDYVEISREIKELRAESKMCENILSNAKQIEKNLSELSQPQKRKETNLKEQEVKRYV